MKREPRRSAENHLEEKDRASSLIAHSFRRSILTETSEAWISALLQKVLLISFIFPHLPPPAEPPLRHRAPSLAQQGGLKLLYCVILSQAHPAPLGRSLNHPQTHVAADGGGVQADLQVM